MTTATTVKTTGAIWNIFYGDKAAWPEGAYHDDTLLSVNGKQDPRGELEQQPSDATVEILCGYVMFSDGTKADLAEHFTKWWEEKSAQGVAIGSFRVSKSSLVAVQLAILAAGGELIE